jgi:DNA polymerase III delta prime subunit
LNFDTPVNFGQDELVKGLDREKYVESLHGPADRDPVQELANQIDLSDSAGAYLFTGNRGTGKTTELLRLATILREYDCEVFYADMADYLTLTQRIEVSDFLISVLGALSEKIADRFKEDPGKPSFFERLQSFLNSNVQFNEIKVPAGWIEFKAALQQNPTFKEQLQEKTRGVVEQLVKQARDFAVEAVQYVRGQRANPDGKVVLIVDSVERLRGVGDTADIREVFKSAETVFSSHADKLRFTALNVVYTVPPYLSALAGALGSVYAGGRIYALPNVHIYERCPEPGNEPVPHADGLAKMREVVEKRFSQWRDFFTEEQLARLAQHSGGDLRDYLRMLRLAVARLLQSGQLPVPDALITDAEDAVRGDMLPIADNDRAWLNKIMASHKAEVPSLDSLPDFARLQEGKYLLHYRNGENWYDVHPLLRAEVKSGGNEQPSG